MRPSLAATRISQVNARDDLLFVDVSAMAIADDVPDGFRERLHGVDIGGRAFSERTGEKPPTSKVRCLFLYVAQGHLLKLSCGLLFPR